MERMLSCLLLFVLVLFSGCNIRPTATESPELVEDVPSSFESNEILIEPSSLTRMLKTIEALCQEPRPIGSDHEKDSAEYLYKELTSYSYSVDILPFEYILDEDVKTLYDEFLGKNIKDVGQTFFSSTIITDSNDGTSQNVIAKKSSNNIQAQTLIISAHYDSVEDSLGVVDNASGVAVVLELAYQLRETPLPYNIWFVFFSGEENCLLGSRNFLRDMPESEKNNLIGNLNVDCVAHVSDLAYSVCAYGYSDSTINVIAESLLTDQRINLDFGKLSDHFSFYVAGIPSALLIQSTTDDSEILDNLNSPSDTFKVFDEIRLLECIDILLGFTTQLSTR